MNPISLFENLWAPCGPPMAPNYPLWPALGSHDQLLALFCTWCLPEPPMTVHGPWAQFSPKLSTLILYDILYGHREPLGRQGRWVGGGLNNIFYSNQIIHCITYLLLFNTYRVLQKTSLFEISILKRPRNFKILVHTPHNYGGIAIWASISRKLNLKREVFSQHPLT